MINSQTAAGSTIELPGYGYELPTEREYEDLEKILQINQSYSKKELVISGEWSW